MTTLLTPPFDVSVLPPALAAIAPQVWMGFILISLILIAYFAGYLFKRFVRAFGRRTYKDPDLFLGSSWDLAAPLTQLLVFLAVFTGGAELVGYFAPHEGSSTLAYGVYHIESLAAYEHYRAKLAQDPLGKENYAFAQKEKFLLGEERCFLKRAC